MLHIPKTAWLLALLSAVLQILIFPSLALSSLAWIALAPLLVAILRVPGEGEILIRADARELSPSQAFLVSYAAGVVWWGGTCFWIYGVMHRYGELSIPVALGVWLLFCLYLGLYHGLFGWLLALTAHRSGGIFSRQRALALAPFLWVAVELARTRITGFPWDLLGTAQVDNIPLTRIATVTGVYGVSFAVLVVNSAFAAVFLVPRARRRNMLLVTAAAAVILQLGVLVKPSASTPTHRARLVQQNVPILEGGEWTVDYFAQTLAELTQLSTSGETAVESAPPRLVIWPESPAPFWANDPTFRAQLSGIARRAQVYVIAGSLGVRDRPYAGEHRDVLNSAVLVTPQGEFTGRYDKIHLVPFGEYVPFHRWLGFADSLVEQVGNFGQGSERKVFPVNGHNLGVFICYESIFPDEVRRFAAGGAEVLVNISNDAWFGYWGAPGQHFNMARMRAIENRRWLLRSTNTGITASIDPFGRIVARAPLHVRTALDAPYGFISRTTFYTRQGDWFAYGCAIISLMAVILRFRLRAVRLRR